MSQNMSLHMIDFNQRNAERHAQRFRKTIAYQKRTQQSRSTSKGDCTELIEFDLCLFQGFIPHRNNILLMSSGRQFRYNSAISLMTFLSGNNIGKNFAVLYDGGACIVTRGFNS